MIIFMSENNIDWSKLICVTNRKLCSGNFLNRIEKIAQKKPAAIILREKDMTLAEYTKLAAAVAAIGERYNVKVVLHYFSQLKNNYPKLAIHLPLPVLRNIPANERKKIALAGLGTSCHSLADAKEAVALGCTYIVAGHIYDTACKQGLPGRGIEFLQNITEQINIPVYAIGGITPARLKHVIATGAKGACIMSGLMHGDTWKIE